MTWNKGKPVDGRKAKYIDDDIKVNNNALETAIDQDHDFTTGGTQTGKHDQVSLIEAADIGTGAEGLPILGAQTASGKAELVFTDEDDNDVQITSGGSIPSTSLDMKNEPDMSSDSENHVATQQSIKAYSDSATQTMTNKTLTSPTITSPTITSPTLNTSVSGTAIKDEPDMSSDSDSHLATQQSIKKYVDDNTTMVPAITDAGTGYSGEESITFPNGAILKQGTATVSSGEDISFDDAFSNAVLSITVTPRAGASRTASYAAESVSGFTVYHDEPGSAVVSYQVWGY